MATTVLQHYSTSSSINPKPRRVCFSFAAYANILIDHLNSSNVPIADGLTDHEFSAIESQFRFTFPPDLRYILQTGLPIGPGFPNWRSSSSQQLEVLASLPALGICKEVSRNNFWPEIWDQKPQDTEEALSWARGYLRNAPFLVPIFRHCYMPSTPCLAGNPVFYVNGGEVRLWSYDIAGFFQNVEFKKNEAVLRRPSLLNWMKVPAWAATEARRIEFWTNLAEEAESSVRRWWWWSGELGWFMEEACRRLTDGGWKEEDVREMMTMVGCDDHDKEYSEEKGGESIAWHVTILSEKLLCGGWSMEEVVELLGSPLDYSPGFILEDLDH